MSRPHTAIFLVVFTLVSFLYRSAGAQEIPAPLSPWIPWVENRVADRKCAFLQQQRNCIWPSSFELDVAADGGVFRFKVATDNEGVVPLPGGGELYPSALNVSQQNRSIEPYLIQQGSGVGLWLAAGLYEVSGRFHWSTAPRAIALPEGTAQVVLRRNGQVVPAPRVANGSLWLAQEETKSDEQGDALSLEVSRKLSDDTPFLITTSLELRISGRQREIPLGIAVPENFIPVRVLSPLPYHLNERNHLSIQARPGTHQISIDAVAATPPTALKLPSRDLVAPEWPEEEFWAFEPREDLRNVMISGAVAIDPSRTSLPDQWHHLRAFLLGQDAEFKIEETRRGEQTSPQNIINIERTLWLDLDGSGLTVRDTLAGQLFQGWRLNAASTLGLGRATVNGQEQLITRDPVHNNSGLEVRDQNVTVVADSRIEDRSGALPSSGWNHTAQSLRATLLLPPGWTLFAAPGTDSANGAWTASWTLLDVFLVLLIAIATIKLLGAAPGILVAIVLILSHGQPLSPLHLWFHLIASLALVRHLPSGDARTLALWYFRLTLGLVCLVAIAFVAEQIRVAIYPQTELGAGLYGSLLKGLLYLAESSVITWLATCLLVVLAGTIVMALVRLQILRAFGYAALFVVIIMVTVMLNGFGSGLASREAGYSQQVAQNYNSPVASSDLAFQLSKGSGYEEDDRMTRASKIVKQKVFQQDPKAVIQTGPGLPTWQGRSFFLHWQGPVEPEETFSLRLISPSGNLAFGFARALLLIGFLGLLIKRSRRWWATVALLVVCLLAPVPGTAQDIPSREMLQELEERITRNECKGDCAVIESAEIEVHDDTLVATLIATSRGAGAIALPGPLTQAEPKRVETDGTSTERLRADAQGFIWVRLEDGRHQVRATLELKRRDTVTLQFPLRPLVTNVSSTLWGVEGVSPTGVVSSSLQLVRKARADSSTKELQTSEALLHPWYQVHRSLSLDLPWTVTTTIERQFVTERPSRVRVPLIHGESVNDDAVKVEGGYAIATFARGSSSISWESLLDEQQEITLKAAERSESITETWTLSCSPIWRCTIAGLRPTASTLGGTAGQVWRPFPGEGVTIGVAKPLAAEGRSVTIESALHALTPGKKLLDAALTLVVRASQGGTQTIRLVDTAKINRVMLNERDETARVQGVVLDLPLEPGETRITITYTVPQEIGVVTRAPEVKIEGSVYNVTTTMQVPESRWLFLTRGPAWGPAVLFWPKLLVVILGAWLLSRWSLSPLNFASWTLLGVGLATLSVTAIVLPIAWLLVLELRRRRQFEDRRVFNVTQVGIVLLTLAALRVLYEAIRRGLILTPNMMVSGGGSNNSLLSWYTDVASSTLPSVSVVWLPMWAWHAVMIAWSLWLVLALLRWLARGFESFSTGGLWKKSPAKEAKVKAE